MSDTPRTAIVTGAARGIGASVARRLCRDGITVAVLDLDEGACQAVVDELRSAGGTAHGFAADVSDEASVEAAVAEISRSMGPPLILVNNAGILRDNLLFKMTVDDWDAVMGVHLRGAFLMSRAAQRHMIEASWGRIVNLSSTSALGNRGQANYAAAKAGMQGSRRPSPSSSAVTGLPSTRSLPGSSSRR
jgi:3-oxoacyl-[acyl-carrier protein] reductase